MTETAPVLTYGRKAGSGSTDSMAEAASETEERRIVLTESAARRIATLKTKEDAESAFLRLGSDLASFLARCGSGKELVGRGFAGDVDLAAELNVSDCVPVLADGAYVPYARRA